MRHTPTLMPVGWSGLVPVHPATRQYAGQNGVGVQVPGYKRSARVRNPNDESVPIPGGPPLVPRDSPPPANVRGMGGSELDVLVVGAGVVGLTTALCLAESGLRVGIRTAAPPGASTSAAAGAVWGPVMAGPAQRIREWARTSLYVLRELENDPATGIRSLAGRELSRVPADWIDLLDDVRLCRDDEFPPGFVSGWRYTAPVVNMPVYLEYLRARFDRAGGRIGVNPVTSLADVTARGNGASGSGKAGKTAGVDGVGGTGDVPPVIVNCSGAPASSQNRSRAQACAQRTASSIPGV